jgi:hypothetical protein
MAKQRGSTPVRSFKHACNTPRITAAGRFPQDHNLGTMRAAHNPRRCVLHCAGGYRAGAAAGAVGVGNGDAAGAAAAGFGFGFFGRIGLRAAFGGGPAGWSSPTTGLGSIDVDAGVEKSPGILITWTGTVSG